MLSETGIWLWAAKPRDTTNRITRRVSWIQLLKNLMQPFQSLSGGFLSPGSLVVKEVWGATNDSMFLAAECRPCKSCRTLVLQDFRFSFTTEVKRSCTWFSKFSFHLLYFMHIFWFIRVWVWEWKRKLTDLSISHHFSVMLLDAKRKKKEENPSSNEKAFLEMETVDRAEKNCLKCHKIWFGHNWNFSTNLEGITFIIHHYDIVWQMAGFTLNFTIVVF